MRLLVLGGTVFLGRHLVAAALAAGHQVTLFNRGRHPGVFPDLEQLHGDRDGGLDPLRGRTWDAAVDTSGYVPRVVRAGADFLAGAVGHYTFISSISVYRDFSRPDQDEGAPLGVLEDPTVEEVTGETYGPLKARCEQTVRERFPGRALIVRPGLIVGPHDPTDRFTYWPWRLSQGGEVLAPGRPDLPVQFVDVRDLAAWTVGLAEAGATGDFNATGPEGSPPDWRYTMGDLLETCRAVGASPSPGDRPAPARLTWVDEDFLLRAGVRPWTELPLWVPSGEARIANMQRVDCSRARAAGLTFRPVAQTVQDTLAWTRERPLDAPWRAGLPAPREAEVLRAWHAGEGGAAGAAGAATQARLERGETP
jgi:2'-hydroxyisoflavone reductase